MATTLDRLNYQPDPTTANATFVEGAEFTLKVTC